MILDVLSPEEVWGEHLLLELLILGVLLLALVLDHVEDVCFVLDVDRRLWQRLVHRAGEEFDVSLRVVLDVAHERAPVGLVLITSARKGEYMQFERKQPIS